MNTSPSQANGATADASPSGPDPAFAQDAVARIQEWIDGLGGEPMLRTALVWTVVAALAWLANLVAKKFILRGVSRVAARTRTKLDDALVENRVFERLSQLAPALVFYVAAPLLAGGAGGETLQSGIQRLALVWMIVAGARAASGLFDALVAIGQDAPATRDKPLRSYAQVATLVLWLAVGIFSVAVLIEKSPWALFTGLGAMTAILLLVFKDSILGFVASIQIAANDMLRKGDWVEMPRYGADGDVIDIGLHTVKVQNWDKTISMIPTHAFLNESFRNWRGMAESGGRRIKRAFSIDTTSVRFLEAEDRARLGEIQLLAPYLAEREKEIEAWNAEHGVEASSAVNGRRLTNLGTFRKYVETYLRSLEPIREDMTFLVRQLAPTSKGVPLEIYCFSGEQRWVQYEGIMGDIFDHLLAVVDRFGLRVFQEPGSEDLRSIAAAHVASAGSEGG